MYRTVILFVLAYLIYASDILAQETDCLTSSLKEIKSISPDDTEFSDLQFLRETLKDVEIVALGEANHGDGTTYESKVRLVKFLHEELGFDVLAFESGLYDCNKAWQLIEQGENADTAASKSVFGIWSMSEQVKPLFQYLEAEKRSQNPLVLTGFDFQFSGSSKGALSEELLVSDFKSFLLSLHVDSVTQLVNSQEWDAFAKDIQDRTSYASETGQAALPFLEKTEIHVKKIASTREIEFWLQWIKSTKYLIMDPKREQRDKYMAENLIWIKEHYYPGKKIICWAATSHVMFNPAQLGIKHYEKDPPKGDFLKERYGEKYYAVGFVAFEGERIAMMVGPQKIEPAKKNSLEYIINQHCTAQNCFVNFRELNDDCFLVKDKIKVRPLGFKWYSNIRITQILDGVIFHKKMEESRMIR